MRLKRELEPRTQCRYRQNVSQHKESRLRKVASFIGRQLRTHADSLFSIAIRITGIGFGFLITLFIGRMLGAEAIGQYGIITQTGLFLSLLCVGGLDLSIVRSFSEAQAARKTPSLQSFAKLSVIVALVMIGAIIILIAFEQLILSTLLDGTAAPNSVSFIIIILIARGSTRLTSAFLRSQRDYIVSQIIETSFIPLVVILLIIFGVVETLEQILFATAAAGVVAGLAGVVRSLKRTSNAGDAFRVPLRPLIIRAVPLWGVSVSKNLSDWYSLAVAAAVLSLFDAGIFRVSMQIASALPLITVGIFAVYAPKFGTAHSQSDYARVASLAKTASILGIALGVPAGFLGILFAEPLLRLFGPEFSGNPLVLQILVVGQVLYVCTGPSGLVLAMTGNEKINLLFTIISLCALIVSLPLAAETFGIEGLVGAMSTILILRNIASYIAVRKLVGISILAGRYTSVANSPSLP